MKWCPSRLFAFMALIGCVWLGAGCESQQKPKTVDATCEGNAYETIAGGGFQPSSSSQVAFILTDESGRVDRGGRALSESDCINALMARGFRVVERSKLDSIVKEQLRRESGLMNEGDAVSAGKLANAQGIIIVQVANIDLDAPATGKEGIFSRITGDLRMTARWIDVESGVVMWNVKGTRKIDRSVLGGTLIGTALSMDKVNHRDELTKLVKCTLQQIPGAGGTTPAPVGNP